MMRTLALFVILIVANPLVFTPATHTYAHVSNQRPSSETQPQESFSSSDPLQIFLYVRNKFVFQPYFGYIKGVNGTINAGGGNDFDQAAVLVYLLHRARVQARYVEGMITLNVSALQNWLGVETSNATLTLLDESGISYRFQAGGKVQIGHVWVEAYLNGEWVQMDPSFKQYRYQKSMIQFDKDFSGPPLQNGTQVGPYSVANIDTGQLMKTVDYYQAKALQGAQMLEDTYPGASRAIIQVHGYTTPIGAQVALEYDEIPSSERYYVEATIPSFDTSINDFSFARNVSGRYPTTALSESRLTLYFVPVDSATLKYIQSFPNLLEDANLDVGRVKMYPVLRFNSTYGIVGGAMPLGYWMPVNVRISIGNKYTISSGGFRPHLQLLCLGPRQMPTMAVPLGSWLGPTFNQPL